MILTKKLPYTKNICELFQSFSDESYAILLDSGKPSQSLGRYDIFTAFPEQQLQIKNNVIEHIDTLTQQTTLLNLSQAKRLLQKNTKPSNSQQPFIGGWLGFAEYELAEYLHASTLQNNSQLLFWAGYYSWAVIQDHQQQSCQLVWQSNCSETTLNKVNYLLENKLKSPLAFTLTTAFEAQINYASYQRKFEKIQQDIRAGLYTHLNFAQSFQAEYQGSPFAAYQTIRDTVPSHYMAYINHPSKTILSISPECYLKAHQQQLQTQPIKGTAPRSLDPQQDKQLALELQQSEKNRLENALTVEAVKKELQDFCQNNSVFAQPLYELQSFANVHHLVSTVHGEIKTGLSIWDVFFACFPGSSISGSPKNTALNAIKQYEGLARGPYCGSVFLASNHGYFDSNIAIRTFVCQANSMTTWAGGGITKKSSCQDEYQECFNKIQIFLAALEQFSDK